MKHCKQRWQKRSGRAMRRCIVGLSAAAGLIAGFPGANTSSATSAAAGMWRQFAMAADTFEVLANATACVRLLVDYGGVVAERVSTALMGALGTMIPLYQVFVVVALVHLLGLFLKQALAHVVLKGIEERLIALPGDKSVSRSPGIGDVAFVLSPAMDSVYPENRAWFLSRTLGLKLKKHPLEAARMLRRIPVAGASVHDLRCVLRLLRASWLFAEDRATLDYVQMRSFDLRDFEDCGGLYDAGRSSAAGADGSRAGGGAR